MFLFIWFQLIKLLEVFEFARYMIYCLGEILQSIAGFMVILIFSCFAFAHVTSYYSVNVDDLDNTVYNKAEEALYMIFSQFIAIIPLPTNASDFDVEYFLITLMFAFFIPLVLLNFLIALMAKTFDQIFETKVAADSKQLAKIIWEIEVLTTFFKKYNKKNNYFYCIFTEGVDINIKE